MQDKQSLDRLYWLKEAWNKQAGLIDKLNRRMMDMRSNGIMSSKLRSKIAKMLDQISFGAEKERKIVDEIEKVERQHRFMRQNKLLRTSTPETMKALNIEEDTPEVENKNKFWPWFLLAMALRKKKVQNQSPKVSS